MMYYRQVAFRQQIKTPLLKAPFKDDRTWLCQLSHCTCATLIFTLLLQHRLRSCHSNLWTCVLIMTVFQVSRRETLVPFRRHVFCDGGNRWWQHSSNSLDWRNWVRHWAPRYLAYYCVPVYEGAGRHHLRVWNSLPDHLRDPAVDPEQFRPDRKTYLFAGHSKR